MDDLSRHLHARPVPRRLARPADGKPAHPRDRHERGRCLQHRARIPGRHAGCECVPVDLRHHGDLRDLTGDWLAAQRRPVRQLDAQGRARDAVRHLGHLLPVRRDRRQRTCGLPARLARTRLVVLRLEPRAARLHRVLRAARERAAGIGGIDAARRGRARTGRHRQGRDGRARDRSAATRLHRVRSRDGPHLLRFQVPALCARFLVRADPRRALRPVHVVRRLLLHGLRLGRIPRRARRGLLVRPHSRCPARARDLPDDLRLPRRHDGDVVGRADLAGALCPATRPHRLHGDGAGFPARRPERHGCRQPPPGRGRRGRDQRPRLDRADRAGACNRLVETEPGTRRGVRAPGRDRLADDNRNRAAREVRAARRM